jgi:hypothetical protein
LYKAHEQRTGSFDFVHRGCTLCASALLVKDAVKSAIAAVTNASLATVQAFDDPPNGDAIKNSIFKKISHDVQHGKRVLAGLLGRTAIAT